MPLPRRLRVFRFAAVCLATLTLSLPPVAAAAESAFVRVWPAWRTAESFERIGEFFGGAEPGRGETILRTQAAAREGYYFLVRTKSAPPDGARFELHVIRPDAPEAKVFAFPVAAPSAKATAFHLGLTGIDWPGGKDAHPVAWKLALVAADGRTLTEQKSFLWEKPAK